MVVTPGVMRDKQLRVPRQELYQGRAGAGANHTGCCAPTQCRLQVFQVPLDLEKTAGRGMTRGIIQFEAAGITPQKSHQATDWFGHVALQPHQRMVFLIEVLLWYWNRLDASFDRLRWCSINHHSLSKHKEHQMFQLSNNRWSFRWQYACLVMWHSCSDLVSSIWWICFWVESNIKTSLCPTQAPTEVSHSQGALHRDHSTIHTTTKQSFFAGIHAIDFILAVNYAATGCTIPRWMAIPVGGASGIYQHTCMLWLSDQESTTYRKAFWGSSSKPCFE